jgi:hypothetical protein
MADMRDVIHDNIQGITVKDRVDIRMYQQRVTRVLVEGDAKHEVAYLSLLNVLARVIADMPEEERTRLCVHTQTMLPLYVESYRVKEKKI